MFLLMILRGTGLSFAESDAIEELAKVGVIKDTVGDGGLWSLPLHKASGCAVRRTGFEHDMRYAADSRDMNLPLNWHSNCDIAHEVNCDEETKDSGAREKLHSNCDRVSAGTTMRHMSIAHRCGEQRKTHKNQKPRS